MKFNLDPIVTKYESIYTTEGLYAADAYLANIGESLSINKEQLTSIKKVIVDAYLHTNLNGRKESGFLFMTKESDDCFHMVPVDYEERDYINNKISLSYEDHTTMDENGDIVLDDEVPRLTIMISSLFVDIESIKSVLSRINGYFKYE